MVPVSANAAQTTLKITKQPQNGYAQAGQIASVTLSAQGDGVQYQWYLKDPGDKTFGKSSVQKNTYSFTLSARTSGRQVYCVITDDHGDSVTSKTVTLKIPTPLRITMQPNNSYVELGEKATISLTAQGDELQYQWYLQNPGQSKFYESSVTGPAYTAKMSSKSAGRQVYCVITDVNGNTVETETVTLSMK